MTRDISLKVFLHVGGKKQLVGELLHHNREVLFEYDADFLKANIDISPFKLPLQPGIQKNLDHTFQGLPGVFNDSLPDGWGLLLMDRFFRQKGFALDKISPLERLAYLGDRGMGALSYEPANQFSEQAFAKSNLATLAKECEQVLRGRDNEVLTHVIIAGGSPGGARPKVLIAFNPESNEIITDPELSTHEFKPYIVKFSLLTNAEDNPNVEFAYSLMAQAAGIQMMTTHLFDAGKYGECFGSERFDRELDHKIHMHTLSGLLQADFRVPNLDYTDFLKVVWLLTKNFDDLCEGFRRMVFNIFTHNRDDHSKNFAFLLTKNGWRLSPAYDLTYSTGVAGEHTMTVAGEGANPSQAHMLQVAKKMNIREKQAKEIIHQVRDTVTVWKKYADIAGVAKQQRESLARIFKHSLN